MAANTNPREEFKKAAIAAGIELSDNPHLTSGDIKVLEAIAFHKGETHSRFHHRLAYDLQGLASLLFPSQGDASAQTVAPSPAPAPTPVVEAPAPEPVAVLAPVVEEPSVLVPPSAAAVEPEEDPLEQSDLATDATETKE